MQRIYWFVLIGMFTTASLGYALQCPPSGDITMDGQRTPRDVANIFSLYFEQLPGATSCHHGIADVAPVFGRVTPGDALCVWQEFHALPSCLTQRPPAYQAVGPVPEIGAGFYSLPTMLVGDWTEAFAQLGTQDNDSFQVNVPGGVPITVVLRSSSPFAVLRNFSVQPVMCGLNFTACEVPARSNRYVLTFRVAGSGDASQYSLDVVAGTFAR